MKRALVLTALLAIAAVGGALAYRSAARDRSYRALLASGEAALAADDTLAAVEDFSGAIAVRPDAMLPRLRRGETYRLRGDLDVAARDFRAAAALDPTATRPLESLGDVLYAQERFKRAAETYEERLKLDDRSAAVRYKLALARYRDGATEVALREARLAIALDDQLADAHYLVALCLRDQGQPAESMAALRLAVERSPGLLPAREELADTLAAAGRFTEQLEELQVLAGLDARRPERQITIGLAQARAGKTDLAIATLSAATDRAVDPSAVNAALGRVWLQVAEERHDTAAIGKALEALERAASALNATSETKALYGRALALSRQPDAAEKVFQQAIERYPVDAAAFLQLGQVAEQLGHLDVARAALMDYVALVPLSGDDAGLASRIGALSLKLSDAKGALPWLTRALAAGPDDVTTLLLMADAQLRLGDAASARATRSRIAAIEPANAGLAALDRRIRRTEIR
ncbi:MAG TPA: tetratricopeptide repeat protein [Vicinamibacterales bacterium]|nr:tetratricopeptide repeat protein [Vicinamibacterales bacterium]